MYCIKYKFVKSISNTNDIIFMPHALTLTTIFVMRTKNSPSEIYGYNSGCCIALGLSGRHEALWSEAFTARIVLSQLCQNKGPKNSSGKFYKTISIFPNGKYFPGSVVNSSWFFLYQLLVNVPAFTIMHFYCTI